MNDDYALRMRQVKISTNVIASILASGNRINVKVAAGLPEDSILAGAHYIYDKPQSFLSLVFLHPSFDEVLGGEIPIQEVILESFE
jgi:hypothetical protein